MRTEIYVQARMGSTRLPGKIMKPVLGKPLLEFLIERLEQMQEASSFAILTTHQPADDVIVEFCQKRGVQCYRGPEEDVLARYHQVAMQRQPDAIVRITSDCPLIDPDITDLVIKTFKDKYPTYDYISNTLELTYPRGLDTEIFSLQALDQAFQNAIKPAEREHVTMYLKHPERFHLKNIASPVPLSKHRWTVDTPEDLTLITLILESLYPQNPHFRLADILSLFDQHPEWMLINRHIKQKLF